MITTRLRFMGFFIQDPDTGTVVGQFPHVFPASIAIGYGIDGLTGARRVDRRSGHPGRARGVFPGRAAVRPPRGGGRRGTARAERHPGLVRALSERRSGDAGAALRRAARERARARGRRSVLRAGRRPAARAAAASCATTPLLGVAARGAGLAFGMFAGQRPRLVVRRGARAVVATGAVPTTRPDARLRADADRLLPTDLPSWQIAAGVLAIRRRPGDAWRWRRRDRASPLRSRTSLPLALAVILCVARRRTRCSSDNPAGELTRHDANALRTFANLYVTAPGVLAALVGFALVARALVLARSGVLVTVALVLRCLLLLQDPDRPRAFLDGAPVRCR